MQITNCISKTKLNIDKWNNLNQNSLLSNEDCEGLNNFMDDLIKSYGYNTVSKSIRKSFNGYELQRSCNECTSEWLLRVNIIDGFGTLYCNYKCLHSFIAKEQKFLTLNESDKIFKIELNKNIWKSLENNKCYQILIKNEMSLEQRYECDRLDEIMNKAILDEYNQNTYTNTITKTNFGYILKRNCVLYKKANCKSLWILEINVNTNQASLKCFNRCQHESI